MSFLEDSMSGMAAILYYTRTLAAMHIGSTAMGCLGLFSKSLELVERGCSLTSSINMF